MTAEAMNCPAVRPHQGKKHDDGCYNSAGFSVTPAEIFRNRLDRGCPEFGSHKAEDDKGDTHGGYVPGRAESEAGHTVLHHAQELPPPISVAARVPAMRSGPRRRPATMKSVLVDILVDEYQPIHSMKSRGVDDYDDCYNYI